MSAIDHKAEAESIAAAVGGVTWEEAPHVDVALAQVHATLYLAEQQRLANVIALADREPDASRAIWSQTDGHFSSLFLRPEIAALLGLNL